MKHIKFLALTVIASLVFFACDDNKSKPEPPPDNPPIEIGDNYSGKLFVDYLGEERISDLDIEIITTQKEDSIVLFLRKVKFVVEQPNGFDIKIPVTCITAIDTAFLSGTEITPYLADMPFPNFRVDNVDGIITKDSLKVAMDMIVVASMGTLVEGTIFYTRYKGALKK